MLEITLNMYQTAGVAMLLFVLGRYLTNRVQFLKACCIPAPVCCTRPACWPWTSMKTSKTTS